MALRKKKQLGGSGALQGPPSTGSSKMKNIPLQRGPLKPKKGPNYIMLTSKPPKYRNTDTGKILSETEYYKITGKTKPVTTGIVPLKKGGVKKYQTAGAKTGSTSLSKSDVPEDFKAKGVKPIFHPSTIIGKTARAYAKSLLGPVAGAKRLSKKFLKKGGVKKQAKIPSRYQSGGFLEPGIENID